jgi:hypothetical protein
MDRFSRQFINKLAYASNSNRLNDLGFIIAQSSGAHKARALTDLAVQIATRRQDYVLAQKCFKLARKYVPDNYWMLRRIRSVEKVTCNKLVG